MIDIERNWINSIIESWKNISFLTNKVADGLYAEGSEESHHEDVGDEGHIAQSHIIDEIVNVVTHLWKPKHYSGVLAFRCVRFLYLCLVTGAEGSSVIIFD